MGSGGFFDGPDRQLVRFERFMQQELFGASLQLGAVPAQNPEGTLQGIGEQSMHRLIDFASGPVAKILCGQAVRLDPAQGHRCRPPALSPDRNPSREIGSVGVMSVRTILVPLDGSAGDRQGLDAAFQVAHHLGAHITALHVEIDPDEAMVGLAATGFYLSRSFRSALLRTNVAGEAAPRATFDRWRAEHHLASVDRPGYAHGGSARFVIDHGTNALRHHALTADLVVCLLSDEMPGGISPEFETALLDAGRPVLAVPVGEKASPDFSGPIAIAWNASREGFRAITSALPLLRCAREVIVLHAGDWHADKLQPMLDYLAWHGISARGNVVPGGEDQGQTLFDEAKRIGTELLVMGGYTHSRTRERLFGGVTERMLHQGDIPVWLSH